jgi:hypothetical protein
MLISLNDGDQDSSPQVRGMPASLNIYLPVPGSSPQARRMLLFQSIDQSNFSEALFTKVCTTS